MAADKSGQGEATAITPGQQILSSCVGAFLTSILMTPLDVVKVRLQAQDVAVHKGRPCTVIVRDGLMDYPCICMPEPQKEFKGTLDAFIKIPRKDGITALWRGLAPTMVMSVPATVLYFTTYDQLRVRFIEHVDPSVAPTLSGLTARLFASTVTSPLELIRTKAQSLSSSQYRDIFTSLRDLIRSTGPSALFRGLVPTLWRDVPFSGIYWGLYEQIKAHMHAHVMAGRAHGSVSSQAWDQFVVSFVGGAVAGTVAAFITTPFDVIKTARQTDLSADAARGVPMMHTWRSIYRIRGTAGLFAGVVPRVVRVAPACAIMIGSYEAGKYYFRQYNQSHHPAPMTSLLSMPPDTTQLDA